MTREIWVNIEVNLNSKQDLRKPHNYYSKFQALLLSALVVLFSELTYSGALTLGQASCQVDERYTGENTVFGGNRNVRRSLGVLERPACCS